MILVTLFLFALVCLLTYIILELLGHKIDRYRDDTRE